MPKDKHLILSGAERNNLLLPPIQSNKHAMEDLDDGLTRFERNANQMMQKRVRETVYLNIYDVTSINRALEFIGFGLYHTSVGIFGLEFSYGGHDSYSPGTVIVMQGNSAGLSLKESLPVGYTYYNLDEVNDIIKYMGDYWLGCDYDPFRKNCNNFTEKFISFVCDKHQYYFPSYINRFTKLGTIFRMWFKPL